MDQVDEVTEVPAQLSAEFERWNWGAFGLSWIWGIGNRTPAAWFVLVPFAGWFGMPFLLGLKGNEWAWRNGNWPDLETFRTAQRLWARRALVAWAGVAVAAVLVSVTVAVVLKQSDVYQLAQLELTADPKLIEQLGQPIDLGMPKGSLSARAGGAGDAELNFTITGPKGKGEAYVSAQKASGKWCLQRTAVDLETGTRIERQLASSPLGTPN